MATKFMFGVDPKEFREVSKHARILTVSSLYYDKFIEFYNNFHTACDHTQVPFDSVDATIYVEDSIPAFETGIRSMCRPPRTFAVAVTGDSEKVIPLINQLVRAAGPRTIAAHWDIGYGKPIPCDGYVMRIPVEDFLQEAMRVTMNAYGDAFVAGSVVRDQSYAQLADYICDGLGDKSITAWEISGGNLWLFFGDRSVMIMDNSDANVEQLFDVVRAALTLKVVGIDNAMPLYADQYTKSTHATVGETAPKISIGVAHNIPFELYNDFNFEGEETWSALYNAYNILRPIIDYPTTYNCFCHGVYTDADVLSAMESPNVDGARFVSDRYRKRARIEHEDKEYPTSGDLYSQLQKDGKTTMDRVSFRRAKCKGYTVA